VSTLKMLVADDSRTVLKFFRDIVAKSSHSIELITAETGHECLQKLESGEFDFAFIDVHMPDMTGMEAVGRSRKEGHRTLITLMSTKADASHLSLAHQLKVYEYLVKPFTAQQIDAILTTYRRIMAPGKALIVDDSRNICNVIGRVLKGSIFRLELEEATDGETALAYCRQHSFDIVFLDCNMPGIDGFATLERMLARRRDTRVIMMSADGDDKLAERALAQGATAFLRKPFFVDDIDRALHVAFGLRAPGFSQGLGEIKSSPA